MLYNDKDCLRKSPDGTREFTEKGYMDETETGF